jgi:hypothetical protein
LRICRFIKRDCARPTTEQILRLSSIAEWLQLMKNDKVVEVFDIKFT